MTKWQKIAAVSDIPEREPFFVDFKYETAALFRVGDAFFAIEDRCTHDDGPLADGELDGYTVMCPRHGAKFDIRSGEALSAPAFKGVPTYQIKVEDGAVYVAAPDE